MPPTPAEIVCDSHDVVGESALWDERTGSLLWIDIVGKQVHRLQLSTGNHQKWPTPDFVTAIGLRDDGGAIVSLTKEICRWDFDREFKPFCRIEPDRPGNRINECVVAPDGSYWVGTMQNNISPDGAPQEMTEATGAYYRVTSSGGISKLTDNTYGITNTMAWTSDGRFITADTLTNQIFSFGSGTGSEPLRDRSLFAPPFERGLPDGSCMDAEGYLWNCRVGGGACLVRHAPDGCIDRVIELPCTSPTSCTFGGSDLQTLFVTSSRFGMSPDFLRDHPHEGNIWAVNADVQGKPCHRFR